MNKALAEHITKEDIQQLPLQAFEGEIIVVDTLESCHTAVKELRKETFIGFDTETKPAFNKGEYNPTALVQLSTPEKAFLFRLNKIGYPQALFSLFEDEEITKLGISISDDLKDLQKLKTFTQKGFIDLNDTARSIGIPHIGVRKLAAIVLEHRISKSQQVTNWENENLSPGQQRYAATDAWICLEIHQELSRKGYI